MKRRNKRKDKPLSKPSTDLITSLLWGDVSESCMSYVDADFFSIPSDPEFIFFDTPDFGEVMSHTLRMV